MPAPYDLVITMTHYNRPDYTRRVLEALSRCRGIDRCLLLPHAEPVNPEVAALLHAARFCDTRVTINPHKLTADANTIRALEEGFAEADFVVHVEDDIVLAPDALEYFRWARDRYRDDQSVLSISGYHRLRLDPPEGADFHKVDRNAWFHPWGVGLFRDRYQRHRRELLEICGVHPDTLFRNNKGRLGWDGAHGVVQQRLGLVEVRPSLSRVQNIGQDTSIHLGKGTFFTHEWHRENQHVPQFAGDYDVPEGEFFEA